MTISLPEKPDGEAYEDLVAASLKLLGYFTETRLVLRAERKEVLELDVVTTPVGVGPKEKCLIEAKKDGISFPNIFKLFGQRTYLNIGSGCLVSLKSADPAFAPVYDDIAGQMGIRLCTYAPESAGPAILALPKNALAEDRRNTLTPVAWYQQIARRVGYAAFIQECAANRDSAFHQAARDYNLAVQSSFFGTSPLARAEVLYRAYMDSPRLTGEAVALLAAKEGVRDVAVWNRLNYTHDLLWGQYLMLVENTARIAIVKNALDDVVERGDAPVPTGKVKIGTVEIDWPLHSLPGRFLNGLELLRQHRHGLRLPYLFQAFVELFGGYLLFNDQAELDLLSEMTGVPSCELVDCLLLLDNFFAPTGGTCFYRQMGDLLCMKMVPGFVRGGGSFLRMALHGLTDSYLDKYPKCGWLLAKWHNALYYALEPTLRKTAPV